MKVVCGLLDSLWIMSKEFCLFSFLAIVVLLKQIKLYLLYDNLIKMKIKLV